MFPGSAGIQSQAAMLTKLKVLMVTGHRGKWGLSAQYFSCEVLAAFEYLLPSGDRLKMH